MKATMKIISYMYTGIYNYSNGAAYMGQWNGGKRHGNGTLISANEDVYYGEWILHTGPHSCFIRQQLRGPVWENFHEEKFRHNPNFWRKFQTQKKFQLLIIYYLIIIINLISPSY